VASRLVVDALGRLTCVQTTPEIGTPIGVRFLVLGDTLGDRIYFLAKEKGRRPTLKEQAMAKGYSGGLARKQREQRPQVNDDQLAEAAAIELARLEQQREPSDLISRAA
jgi:hypothetical protein